MWLFSESVNEYLGKELVSKENEYSFLQEFKNACEDQVDGVGEEMIGVTSIISIWGEKLPVVYDIEIGIDGILETTNQEIDFGI